VICLITPTGSVRGTRDESTAIFYDTRRLRPLEAGQFWLSDTPTVIGSRTWGNHTIRMATWARFADNRTGVKFVVFDTQPRQRVGTVPHTHCRTAPRPDQRRRGEPVVVLIGDFNAPATTSAPYNILTSGAGLTDTWIAAAHRRTPQYSTVHGFGPPIPRGARIDWVFTRAPCTVSAAAIDTTRSSWKCCRDGGCRLR